MSRVWSGLRGRVILTYLVIFLVSAAIVAVSAGLVFSRMTLEGAERELEVRAYVWASALERPWVIRDGEDGGVLTVPQPQLQTLAGNFAQGSSTQLTVLDVRGNTVATSQKTTPDNQVKAPEVMAALTGWVRHDVRFDPIAGQRMIFAAAPIQRGGHVLAIVQVATPVAEVTTATNRFWLTLGLIALLAAGAAALAGWLLAGQLVRPVDRLRGAAVRLAAGDLEERVPPEDSGGVAEIGQLAEAFNHMAERIGDMINRERAFVANASHELRTPLTNIKLRAEALGNGALDDPTVARRWVGEIESEANRLTRMAGDLLTLSRHDAAAAAFREKIDPAVLINDVTQEMSLRAERSGVTLVRQIAPNLPALTADPVGMYAVLSNLLDNALQYTAPGGSITIGACLGDGAALAGPPALLSTWAPAGRPVSEKEQHAGEDRVRLGEGAAESWTVPGSVVPAPANGYGPAWLSGSQALVVTVADTGAGIPEEDLPHIFDRFYRADKSRSRKAAQRGVGNGSGAGLGLAIVRGIVEEHGGVVTAESTVGVGTTMMVRLPLDRA